MINLKKAVLAVLMTVSLSNNVSAIPGFGKYKKQYPLHYAVSQCNYKNMLEVLVDFEIAAADVDLRAIINSQDDQGKTPLHIASSLKVTRKNHEKIKQIIDYLIINHSADVNIRDNDGNTPLFYLMPGIYDKLDFFVFFLMNGALINIKNKKEETVWDVFFKSKETQDGLARFSSTFPKIAILMFLDSSENVSKYERDINNQPNKTLKDFYNQYKLNKDDYLIRKALGDLKYIYNIDISCDVFIGDRNKKILNLNQ
ncbi:MAG: ankyrin repeat domain-containing protein [bacterium]